tara:strand:+ start:997 stop:1776 length:780 start_codon:yes stop_codon:yes gene_type:complete
MVNAWSLAYDTLNGTLDENFPIMTDNKITPQESDEYDPIIKLSDTVEHSDAWYDYKRNDPNRENPFTDPKDRERAEMVVNSTCTADYPGLNEVLGDQDITITTDLENVVTVPEDTPWIYESPDGGKTVTRRKPGDDYTKKEVITGDYFDQAKPQPDLNYKSQKYQEDKGIADLKDYVSSTYRGHYTNKNSDTQTLDLIHSVGDAESFCRSNALKYLSRYDKKGSAKQDILKAMHYCLLLYYFSGNTKEPEYTNARYETF